MIYLVLAIVCTTIVGHIFTLASHRSLKSMSLLFVNYFFASVAAFAGTYLHPAELVINSWVLPSTALVLGVLFLFNYMMLAAAIKHMGIALPVTLMRVSVAWPVLGSIFIFGEMPHLPTILAITAIFLSLPLASPQPIDHNLIQRARENGIFQALLLFVATGVTEFLFKVQAALHPLENPFFFVSMIFPVAFLLSGWFFLRSGERLNTLTLGLGLALGVFNVLSTVFVLLALHEMPGIIVFPVYAAGIIVLSTISGILIWRERPAMRQYIFILVACCAIAFLYR